MLDCCVKCGRFGWIALAVTVGMLALAALPTARAQDGDGIQSRGEVEAYAETFRTHFAGGTSTNQRGRKPWDASFGDGLKDGYPKGEPRIEEAELRSEKTVPLNESWVLDSEMELKASDASRNEADFELEQHSATSKQGPFNAAGILEDKKLYEGGLVLEPAFQDAKGFDENPGTRVGYRTGEFVVDLRYSSLFVEVEVETDIDGGGNDESFGKRVNQTELRLQAEYVADGAVMLLGTFTLVDSSNKEDANFQYFKATFNAGLRFDSLGPGNLIVEVENGTSDISVENVSFAGEYLWTHERSSWGPGVKFFQNDADEKLKGTATYFGGEWRF